MCGGDRYFAQECIRLADKTNNLQHRAKLLDMAQE